MSTHPVLIAGQWRAAQASGVFQAENPATGEPLPEFYPISTWADCDAALAAAVEAFDEMRRLGPAVAADFLDRYAARIEKLGEALVEAAHAETALPVKPRLADVELPRTVGQLRQAAAAARDGSWALATIDTKLGIRSLHEPIGPTAVFGPNNFPFAFGGVSGGDFAAAVAAGNPVIAKAHSHHPTTTRLFAEAAHEAAGEAGLPPGAVQMIYRLDHADGERLVADARLGATGYTGGRAAGLRLKAAADRAGKPIYLELSSINPVVVLPGAVEERGAELVKEFTTSCLMGSGQFCTNPGLVLLLAGDAAEAFIGQIGQAFGAAPVGTLLSAGVEQSLEKSMAQLTAAGAEIVTGGQRGGGRGRSFQNTLLRASGERFLKQPDELQTEAFGAASLVVVADDVAQLGQVLDRLEGNLTGSVYSRAGGSDDALYDQVAPRLRARVGRLLNDKMPTGVAVSPAMNHGGPYPATGHPGFTAVGMPASLRRFSVLACYDNVRPGRLPAPLRDKNPTGSLWRSIDGVWTQANVVGA